MTLVLVTMAQPHFAEYDEHDHLGRLVVPDHFWRVADTARSGLPWAADNGAFGDFDVDAYRRMLSAITDLPGCLFVAVPDVVADADATLARFAEWADEVAGTGQPLALVAQDGLTPSRVPWARVGALFVGGSTEWKLGAAARELVQAARARGVHVHMGRVNGRRRYGYARSIGCDSIDGSGLGRFHRTHLRAALRWRDQTTLQVDA